MGNYRFRLSDMMPNAWFYKLKDMGRTRSHNTSHPIRKKQATATTPQPNQPKQPHLSQPRRSYYFTREPIRGDGFYNSPKNPKVSDTQFPESPRKPSKRRAKRRTIASSPTPATSTVSAGCSCRATLESVWTKPDSTPEYSVSPLESSPEHDLHDSFLPEFGSQNNIVATESYNGLSSWSGSCGCRVSSSTADIIIDMDNRSFARKFEKLDGFDAISELDLPPILTKPAKFHDTIRDVQKKEPAKFRRSSAKLEERTAHGSLSVKVVKEESVKTLKEQKTSTVRRSSSNSPGVKLRANSPRIASKKIQAYSRKSVSSTTSSSSRRRSLSESFAIVKSSFDPQRDFRNSMVEMIVENNIRASKDLEELLACYLSLNSDEYHDLIVKVFQQIWFDLTDTRL
ncbi:hypothetical protein HHK36_010589 [Tetracentron sinense]|uniref:Transcription repressor n=1 Tax=Tetracentron sinense TaxID=13715 RepID=A0A834Z6L9_TETSI|nr:hypothetical protein HHK36_010589 [Tetracentron sinense]